MKVLFGCGHSGGRESGNDNDGDNNNNNNDVFHLKTVEMRRKEKDAEIQSKWSHV